jgi:peptide/nickel transport system substrate-binding protein
MYIDFASQKIIPGLVKSMPEVTADGLQYTYELRKDIYWDDGTMLTVDDIIFTAKAFVCPLTNDAVVRFYWENIENIVTDSTNKNRFTIVMKQKFIHNISFLTGFSILQRKFHDPENILSKYSFNAFSDSMLVKSPPAELTSWADEFNNDKYGREISKLNGLGMYKVSEWAPGQYIVLNRKKNHWTQQSTDYHEVSYPEKIIFKLNKDEASQVLEFKSQAMDVSSNLSVDAFLQLNADEEFNKNYNMAMMPTFNYTYVCFNEKPDGEKHKKLFDDIRVRKALALLTPVDDIIKLMYKQYSDQCRRSVSNVSPLKNEFNHELKPIQFNLKAAEKILADAGWNDSDRDGILDKSMDGVRINLEAELNYISSSQDWKNIAMLITGEMDKAGVKIHPVGMDLKLFVEKAKSHDFDLMLGSWSLSGLAEDYTQLWHSSSWTNHGSNYSGFGNAESDSLIDQIRVEMNDSLRINLSHLLQKKIYDDQPYIFLYASLKRYVIHKRFANQMIFCERPGLLDNMLRLMSITSGITNTDQHTP